MNCFFDWGVAIAIFLFVLSTRGGGASGGEKFARKISRLRKVAKSPRGGGDFRGVPNRAHQEITATIQSPPGNNRDRPQPTKKKQCV